MPYGFQILAEEPLNQIGDNYVLKRGKMLTEVKCSKVCFTIRSLGLKHHQAIKMVTTLKRMLPLNLASALAKDTAISCCCCCCCCCCESLHQNSHRRETVSDKLIIFPNWLGNKSQQGDLTTFIYSSKLLS